MTDRRNAYAIILQFVPKHTQERDGRMNDAPVKFESVIAYRFGADL